MDISKTLQQLENSYWSEPDYKSHLVTTCHTLRQKPLQDYSIEDLRIMIGQNLSLEYLVPLAIDRLSKDILAEGDMYQGDLLKAVLTVKAKYWKENTKYWQAVHKLFTDNRAKLEQVDISTEIRRQWFDLFDSFERINQTNSYLD